MGVMQSMQSWGLGMRAQVGVGSCHFQPVQLISISPSSLAPPLGAEHHGAQHLLVLCSAHCRTPCSTSDVCLSGASATLTTITKTSPTVPNVPCEAWLKSTRLLLGNPHASHNPHTQRWVPARATCPVSLSLKKAEHRKPKDRERPCHPSSE